MNIQYHTKIASSKILELNNPPLFSSSDNYASLIINSLMLFYLETLISDICFSNNIISCNASAKAVFYLIVQKIEIYLDRKTPSKRLPNSLTI